MERRGFEQCLSVSICVQLWLTCAAPLTHDCQATWLPLKPRNPGLLPSVLDTLNCAKMAHVRSLGGHGGGTEGARRGKGGAPVSPRDASGVPFWHTTPSSLSMSISNRYPKMPSPSRPDRKSTRLNSSHLGISYDV